uniref:Uncharacterized protein n=1 Tax=Rubrivivax gelatinosus S1 TaxID=1138313 RepID=L8B9Y8_RUBGE|nr:conserved exported hypothetical protein [Rubrivivax gelatinosus S1]
MRSLLGGPARAPALLAGALLAFACTGAWSQEDLDALQLESAAVEQEAAPQGKLFAEVAAGSARRRGTAGDTGTSRLSLDAAHNAAWSPTVRTTLSARLDAVHPSDGRFSGAVFSLREGYVSWQDERATLLLDVGRINLRNGPGYGYNPTDFLRDRAVRIFTTVNPSTIRENRLGTFMLRGQRVWDSGSLALSYAPHLADKAGDEELNLDPGATNDRHRWLATLGTRWSDRVSSQLSLYGEDGSSPRWGASATALLTQSLVAHGEWSSGRERDLLSRSLGTGGEEHVRQRGVLGLTYTTSTKLSVTGELHYNGFALDDDARRATAALDPMAIGAYFLGAQERQDNAARKALFVHATQQDLFVKNLELTVLAKFNRTDDSRMAWMDLRYRMRKMDVALQIQRNSGDAGSEFGTLPTRYAAELLAVLYF